LPNVTPRRRTEPEAPGGFGLKAWLITLGSMAVSIAYYASQWSWAFATGFVVLILVHELGHLVAARRFGLRTGPPIFIPMMGAFIALKDRTGNAWVESVVGIGGPLFGTFGAGVCLMIRGSTGDPFWGELAFYGFMLNLFNLAPVGFLDGGRIVTAISPWLWIPGYLLMVAYVLFSWRSSGGFPGIGVMILLMGIPRLFSLFQRRTTEEQRFFDIEPGQRWTMTTAYLGLIVLLVLGMNATRPVL
jgi:Zn-dependent protease